MDQDKDTVEVIDLKETTCGLVPMMLTHLTSAETDRVDIQIRQGIETELWNSFGTGGEWKLISIDKDLFFDIARFERIIRSELDPLGLMDF